MPPASRHSLLESHEQHDDTVEEIADDETVEDNTCGKTMNLTKGGRLPPVSQHH